MRHSGYPLNCLRKALQLVLLIACFSWASSVRSEVDCAKDLQNSGLLFAKTLDVQSVVERYRWLYDSSDRDIYPGARLRIKLPAPFSEVDRECLDRHVPILYIDGFKFPQMAVRYLPIDPRPEGEQGGDKSAGGTSMRVQAGGAEKPNAKSLLFNVIEFEMSIDDQSKDIWLRLHNTPRPERAVDVGIGFKVAADNIPADVELRRAKLVKSMHAGMAPVEGYHGAWTAFVLSIVFGGIAGAYLWLKKDSPLKVKGASSQGTTQAYAWFILIVGMGIHLWMLTGSLPTISPTLLALMGASGSTLIVAAKLNASTKIPRNEEKPFSDVPSIQMWGFNLMVMVSFVIDSHQYLKLAAIEPTWAGVLGISNVVYLVSAKQSEVI